MTRRSTPKAEAGARQPPEYLAVGRVVRPHGVRGGLLVQAYSELLQGLEVGERIYLGNPPRPAQIQSLRPHGGMHLLCLEGCPDRDAAEEYRGAEVRIRMAQAKPLPEGVYYRWQILGLAVQTIDGEPLGTLEDILETGANDVYLVRLENGKELLLPAIKEVIREVDLTLGRLVVEPLPGQIPD